MFKWMYYFHSSGSLESKNFIRSWLQMLAEKNKQTKITERGYLLRDHHKFNCCWHSVHLTMFLLEQADPRGMLQAVARKKWISSADSPGSQRRGFTRSIIFNCHWALKEVEQGEIFVEETFFLPCLSLTRAGEGGIQGNRYAGQYFIVPAKIRRKKHRSLCENSQHLILLK